MVQLTQERLKTLLKYDGRTGKFYWRSDRGRLAKRGWEAGSPHKRGWINIIIDGVSYKAHRLVWLYTYGKWPSGQIDHINRNNSDNRLANLRDVDAKTNARNKGLYKQNKYGISGVYKVDYGFRVEINSSYLGYFKDFFEACCVRKAAEAQYGYD